MQNVQCRISKLVSLGHWGLDIGHSYLGYQAQSVRRLHLVHIDGDDPQLALDPSLRLISIVAGPRIPRLPGGENKASRTVDVSEIHHVPHRRALGAVKRGHELVRWTDVHRMIA